MDVEKAVDQIAEIHRHLVKTEIFYGYKPNIVFSVGIVAFVVAALQAWLIVPPNEVVFLLQWMIVCGIVILIIGGNIVYNYSKNASNYQINQMSKVFLQFVPSLIAGFIITSVLLVLESPAVAFLPGIWAILFGLGIFSMRPYLPRMTGFVAIYYLFAGGLLMYLVRYGLSFSPWGIGITFGTGHIFSALILRLDIDRNV